MRGVPPLLHTFEPVFFLLLFKQMPIKHLACPSMHWAAEWGRSGADGCESVSQAVSGLMRTHSNPSSALILHSQGGYFRISPVPTSLPPQQEQLCLPRAEQECACARLMEQVCGLKKRGTSGTAGEQERDCFFLKILTKASPPVGVVASSSTPRLYKSVSQVRLDNAGSQAGVFSK